IYALDEKRDLTCIDARTGELLWRRRGFLKGSLLRVDDYLLVLGERGNLALCEANPTEFKSLTRAQPLKQGHCWAAPALADGLLSVRDEAVVRCLDLRAE